MGYSYTCNMWRLYVGSTMLHMWALQCCIGATGVIRKYTYILLYIYIYVYIYTYRYTYTCIHMYINICIHIYIYTYIHMDYIGEARRILVPQQLSRGSCGDGVCSSWGAYDARMRWLLRVWGI